MSAATGSFESEFGLTEEEILKLEKAAMALLGSDMIKAADLIFEMASPYLVTRINTALTANWTSALSDAGKALLVMELPRLGVDGRSRAQFLQLFSNPITFRSLPVWCLLVASVEAAATFQMGVCRKPSPELTLSGDLRSTLKSACDRWRTLAAAPLDRSDAYLRLDVIDLSIGGGEQRSGGDFGLILDFDRNGVQPAYRDEIRRRIVPLVLQAKRYLRPNADVSQHHDLRGYQRTYLARSPATAGYIFYENGTGPTPHPLPPLLKRVETVKAPTTTNVLADSVDLPAFLLQAIYDQAFKGAGSPRDALRMIDAEADLWRLSGLAVISNGKRSGAGYAQALRELLQERDQAREQDREPPITI